MPSSPSIFDRLSQQGTSASKQRDAEEKQSRLKNEQRRQKETAALTPTKNNIDRKLQAMQRSPPVPQDRATATNQKNVVCSPKQSDALYDRLAKQETISSAAHYHHGGEKQSVSQDKYSVGGCHSQTDKSPTRTDSELAATFNRLYKQDTASSKAHHHKPEEKSFSPKKKVSSTPPPSLLNRRRLDSESSSGPPVPLKLDVYIRTAEEKKNGQSYNTLDFTQNDVRKQINCYAITSKISAKSLAYGIINALFHRDFTPVGRHWEISSATVEEFDTRLDVTLLKNGEEKGGDNIQVFGGIKEAVWDYKDVYSVAKASAKIKISSGGVYVDEYVYSNTDDANEVKGKEIAESKKVALAAAKKKAAATKAKVEKAAAKKAEDEAASAAVSKEEM